MDDIGVAEDMTELDIDIVQRKAPSDYIDVLKLTLRCEQTSKLFAFQDQKEHAKPDIGHYTERYFRKIQRTDYEIISVNIHRSASASCVKTAPRCAAFHEIGAKCVATGS
ncbi:unnamed protein product [Clonostachys rosea]|uniref:Uncharacterized protein n=1 Tax=Bionectria ochroleuca TaxID=29856 RepID=A0ABY6U279_BIOOC|nr:unnamed protein product [Clonostachys rosea]